MSQSSVNLEDNKVTCEAMDCFAVATKQVVLHVGIKGNISVSLCEDCATNKFGSVK